MRKSVSHIQLTTLSVTVLLSCKPRAESDTKAIIEEGRSGDVKIVYDLPECIAKKGNSYFAEAFDTALKMSSQEVAKRIEEAGSDSENMSHTGRAIAEMRDSLSFQGVSDTAVQYLEDNRARIYGAFGVKLASLAPSAFTFVFYHKNMKAILNHISNALVKPIIGGNEVRGYPYIGVVVVPRCYDAVAANGEKYSGLDIKIGATFLTYWRWKAGGAKKGTTGGAAQTPSASSQASPTYAEAIWKIMPGFVWGAVYEPQQLMGPVFSIGFGRRNAPKGLSPAKENKGWNVILRPMVIWGSQNPQVSSTRTVETMLKSGRDAVSNGKVTSALKPSHFMLYFDFVQGYTFKSYAYPYLGFQLTTGDLVSSFMDRPVIQARSGTVVNSGE